MNSPRDEGSWLEDPRGGDSDTAHDDDGIRIADTVDRAFSTMRNSEIEENTSGAIELDIERNSGVLEDDNEDSVEGNQRQLRMDHTENDGNFQIEDNDDLPALIVRRRGDVLDEESSDDNTSDGSDGDDSDFYDLPALLGRREHNGDSDSDSSFDDDSTLPSTVFEDDDANEDYELSEDEDLSVYSVASSLPSLEEIRRVRLIEYVDDLVDTEPLMNTHHDSDTLSRGNTSTVPSSNGTPAATNRPWYIHPSITETTTRRPENYFRHNLHEINIMANAEMNDSPTTHLHNRVFETADGLPADIPDEDKTCDVEESMGEILDSLEISPFYRHDEDNDLDDNHDAQCSQATQARTPGMSVEQQRVAQNEPPIRQERAPNDRSEKLTYEQVLNILQQQRKNRAEEEDNESNVNILKDMELCLPLLRDLDSKKRRARGPNRSRTTFGSTPQGFQPTSHPNLPDNEHSFTDHNSYRQRFQTRLNMESESSINRIANLDLNTTRAQQMLKPWGDPLTTSEAWPNVTGRTTLRLFYLNPNGISYFNDYTEWEMTLGFMNMMQVDIFGLSEINLDTTKAQVRAKLREKSRPFDQFLKLDFSSSKQSVGNSPYKRGGTITGVNGCWSGRRLPESGQDSLGRWSYVHLRGRRDTIVTVITFYRVCNQSNAGESTVYLQQARDLLQQRRQHVNPRNQILQDLLQFITTLHGKGHVVILVGDMNENLDANRSDANVFLSQANLTNIMKAKHPHLPLPPTHDRGQHCIDLMAISNTVPIEAIRRAGYLPFYYNFASDHRAAFFDIDMDTLFAHICQDNTRTSYKRFTTLTLNRCDKYLQKLEELMERSRIFQQVDKLEIEFLENLYGQENPQLQETILKTKAIARRMYEFMICAEWQCGPKPYENGFPFSKSLQDAGFNVYRCKKLLRLLSIGMWDTTQEERDLAKEAYRQALQHLKECQKNADLLRDNHVEALAAKRAQEWNMEQGEALHILRESEKSRNLHAKHKSYLKPAQNGTLRTIMVPKPVCGLENDMFNVDTYEEVSDPEDIFDILLRQNYRVLQQSKASIFSRGPLLEACGWFAEGTGVEDLLHGLLDNEALAAEYPEFSREAQAFLNALKIPASPLPNNATFKWEYGVKEYTDTFRKTRETTSCGPSGLHMSHWKAACERPRIARVHAFLIWAAMQFGFSYERWEQSWHCMIQKKKDPIYPKLRIVQLFEGDFNAALKYLLGRVLMKHITNEGLFDPEVFGSRVSKTAPEALLNLQLIYDHHRMWNKLLASIFNDADACYDRIPPNLSDICMRRKGCPKTVANCHTQVQKRMKHKVRISAGVSMGYIAFDICQRFDVRHSRVHRILGPIGGIGQGGGGGPIAWISVIMVMLLAYRSLCDGAPMEHGLNWVSYTAWVISYVDDNSLVRSFPNNTTADDFFRQLSMNLDTWNKLLQITGGDLCLDKCEVTVMAWKYTRWGVPHLMSQHEFRGTIRVASCLDPEAQLVELQRIEAWDASRVLGIRLPLSGRMNIEYKFRLKQMKDFSLQVSKAPFTPFDAFMVYQSRYCAMIKFPLPVTLFTENECNNLQKPAIFQLLPKMGLNRHTPRALIYGPRRLGGRELMDLRIEQPVHHFQATLGHLMREDRVGDGLLITAMDLQIIIGSATPVFHLNPDLYSYGPMETRWGYFWNMIHKAGLVADIYDYWVPPLRDPNDRNLMDLAVNDVYYQDDGKWRLYHINRCQLYFQAFNVSDLTSDGTSISKIMLHGETPPPRHRTVTFPPIQRPKGCQFEFFIEFLFRQILKRGYLLKIPLAISFSHGSQLVHRKLTEADIMLDLINTSGEWQQLLEKVPSTLQILLSPLTDLSHLLPFIASSLRDGTITAATDGGFRDDKGLHFDGIPRSTGSHSFILQCRDDPDIRLCSTHRSPHSNGMCSLTTEHYAYISLLIALHIICASAEIQEAEQIPSLPVVIDNAQVCQRILTKPTPFNTGDFIAGEMDLWILQWNLQQNLPFKINPLWTKSHQDIDKNGQRFIGPHNFEVFLNIEADRLTSFSLRNIHEIQIPRPVYSSSKLIIRHPIWETTIDNLRVYLLHKINGKIMIDYLLQQRQWHPLLMASIDWEGLDSFLSTVRPTRRCTLLKLMHNWQNTGHQRMCFMESQQLDMTPALSATTLCPMECGQYENPLHYLRCSNENATEQRNAYIRAFLHQLHGLQTSRMMTSVLNIGIRSVTDPYNNMTYNEPAHPNELESMILRAKGEQEQLGWESSLQGYISKFWGEAHKLHLEQSGGFTPAALQRWKKEFVGGLLHITEQMWTLRNSHLHNIEQCIDTKRQRAIYREKIRDLYQYKHQMVVPADRRVFHRTMEFRLNQSLTQMKLWIGLAEDTIKLHRERATQNTLIRWLGSRSGPPR